MAHDALGQRMKAYEHQSKHTLPARSYTLIRLDGRAFGSYTRGLQRPYDADFATDMDATGLAVAAEVAGAVLGYVQSDEISLLVCDFANPGTQPWFGGVAAKITSLTSALATATFNQRRPPAATANPALFDSRVFTVPNAHEVCAYFLWRQRDAIKNSVSMAAQAHFSHRRLQHLHTGACRDLLREEAGVDWESYPDGFKHGRVLAKEHYTGPVSYLDKRTHTTQTTVVTKSRWVAQPAPVFDTTDSGWLRRQIPVKRT